MTAALLAGFADPVRDSQSTFRALLDAMARPGRIQTLAAEAERVTAPPLDPATAALVLTLVDVDTTLWLDERARAAAGWIAFHCGAPLAEPGVADFAVALDAPPLAALNAGTDEQPERAATLILQIDRLGDGERFTLSGPGLPAPAPFAASGLPPGWLAFWTANRRLFPRGIDVILAAGDRFASLPRTVQMAAG